MMILQKHLKYKTTYIDLILLAHNLYDVNDPNDFELYNNPNLRAQILSKQYL